MVQTASLANTPPNNASRLIEEPWKPVFWAECATVVQALLAEKHLKGSFTMLEWLNLRAVTISGEFLRDNMLYCIILYPLFILGPHNGYELATTASLNFVLTQRSSLQLAPC